LQATVVCRCLLPVQLRELIFLFFGRVNVRMIVELGSAGFYLDDLDFLLLFIVEK
jgi:hypothetical protein